MSEKQREKGVMVGIVVPRDLDARYAQVASERGLPKSALMRAVLAAHLDSAGQTANRMVDVSNLEQRSA